VTFVEGTIEVTMNVVEVDSLVLLSIGIDVKVVVSVSVVDGTIDVTINVVEIVVAVELLVVDVVAFVDDTKGVEGEGVVVPK